MSPRKYILKQRADSAEATRQRIVQATYDLHHSRGVGATTFRDIAAAADVGIGTVYHHFPTYDDLIVACGALTYAITVPPTAAIFERIDSAPERLRTLAATMFAFYERFPAYESIRAERSRFAPIDASMRAQEEGRREMIAIAVRPQRLGKTAAATAYALLDPAVHRSMRDSGLTTQQAAEEVTKLLIQLTKRKAHDHRQPVRHHDRRSR